MRNAIAVMNTKGGVGKSTLVLALAETLAAERGKTVLVIDSDAQASVSSMLMTVASLHKLQTDGLTLVDYLIAVVLSNASPDWPRFVVGNVSEGMESVCAIEALGTGDGPPSQPVVIENVEVEEN